MRLTTVLVSPISEGIQEYRWPWWWDRDLGANICGGEHIFQLFRSCWMFWPGRWSPLHERLEMDCLGAQLPVFSGDCCSPEETFYAFSELKIFSFVKLHGDGWANVEHAQTAYFHRMLLTFPSCQDNRMPDHGLRPRPRWITIEFGRHLMANLSLKSSNISFR